MNFNSNRGRRNLKPFYKNFEYQQCDLLRIRGTVGTIFFLPILYNKKSKKKTNS